MKNGAVIIFAIILDIQMSLASVIRHAPADTTLKEVFKQIAKSATLNFPQSTFRFYQNNNFKPIWLTSSNAGNLSEAMRLLSCVAAFGLNSKDYHPETQQQMRIFEDEDNGRKEILFSDALITLIAHLHFGRANPDTPPSLIDDARAKPFKLEEILQNALNAHFRETILEVQPAAPGYKSLQSYLSQATGKFTGECKDLSTDTLRLIALNLERYRWMNNEDKAFKVHINIPSFMLTVIDGSVMTDFKVVVGKPGNPTPQLSSTINYLNTAPDWNVPPRIFRNELLPKMLKDPTFAARNNFTLYDDRGRYLEANSANLRMVQNNPAKYSLRQSSGCDNALGRIVFRFENTYNVYLHDTPEKSYFFRPYRALSHGCIRVENPKKLLSVLLLATGAGKEVYNRISGFMDSSTKYTYTFSRPIPINISYLTCEMRNDRLIKYDDIYSRDKALTSILFD